MIGFEEDFELSLQVSEQEFSAYLLSIIDTDVDELFSPNTTTKKHFRGYIKFNCFTLIPIQTFFKKACGQIKGEYRSESRELLIKGRVVSDKFLLTFLICYTILCSVMLINSLINSPNEKYTVAMIGIFFLIGIGNLIGVNRSLKRQKTNFLAGLKLFEKE